MTITMTDPSDAESISIFDEVARSIGIAGFLAPENQYDRQDLEKKELLKAEVSLLMRDGISMDSIQVSYDSGDTESDFYYVSVSIGDSLSNSMRNILLGTNIELLSCEDKVNDFIETMSDYFGRGISVAKPKLSLSESMSDDETLKEIVDNEIKRRVASQISLVFSKFIDTGFIPSIMNEQVSSFKI